MDTANIADFARAGDTPDLNATVKRGEREAAAGEGRETPLAGATAGSKSLSDSGAAREENGSASELNFPPLPATPTQFDSSGIRFDFNDGCRVQAPMGPDVWRIRLFDLDTGNILFQTTPDFRGGSVRSAKKYYVRFRIEAWKGEKLVFAHDYDARGRDVLIAFPVGTLGDTIAWLSYATRFADLREAN